jgi:LmbE family N-acetylglucosaminyl deacetylase
MNPYQNLVSQYARLALEGKDYPLGQFAPLPRSDLPANAPTALIFSPHPDDEVISGGLALRLMREAKWRIINVAVTQGSNKERQAPRLAELKACCECIGFGLIQAAPSGLEKVNLKTREQEPAYWAQSVKVIANILAEQKPATIFFPHAADWNSSHIGTHFLVMDALKSLPPDFSTFAVETEFWGAMDAPNLMVEVSPQHLGDLITALTFHVGEVKRNPYHLLLPAWMQDNVRRGGELVGGQGGAAPDFIFATLYRLQRWNRGRLEKIFDGGREISCQSDPAALFK